VLIAGRIWWTNKRIASLADCHATEIKERTSAIMPAAVIIIESGAIYSIMLILLLATYVSSSYAQYFFIDAVRCYDSLHVWLLMLNVMASLFLDRPVMSL
jgi:hypothetical protein